jgi:hypothetical protein
MAPSPSPWVIADRSGFLFDCGSHAEWLAEWRRRLRAIERADRPAPLRRASLEHTLIANAAVFRARIAHGAVDAVLDVTGTIVAADGRLSCLEDPAAAAA